MNGHAQTREYKTKYPLIGDIIIATSKDEEVHNMER